MANFVELPTRAATAYAELLESVRGAELARSVAALSGAFSSKTVKGKRYWYFQYRDVDDTVRQLYVGPDDERVRDLINAKAEHGTQDQTAALAKSAVALGCEPVLPMHFKVIRRLSEYGFFRAGGVLIGTHAFVGCAAMLGVRWADASRTEDLDFAHPGKDLGVALPADIVIDVPAAIDSLALGFIPTSAFMGGSGATYVAAKHGLRIDFLTTRKRTDKPVHVEHLKVAMQPLSFMELLLEHPVQAALLAPNDALLVNLPDPVSFALHKLIVAVERSAAWRTKSIKDLQQAAALLGATARLDERTLRARWRETLARGPKWRRQLLAGRKAVARLVPALELDALLPT